MAGPSPIIVYGAVEGDLDEAVLERLCAHVGMTPGTVYGKRGKSALLQRLGAYNDAARRVPWVVLVDLDEDHPCAPPFRSSWLPTPAPLMCFRIAVKEIEAWLLADWERLAAFLGVGVSRFRQDPETLLDPKRFMVHLASRSRRRDIREDMAPRAGSRGVIGPGYSSRLIEFVTDEHSGWQPSVAATRSESLNRCLRALTQLIDRCR